MPDWCFMSVNFEPLEFDLSNGQTLSVSAAVVQSSAAVRPRQVVHIHVGSLTLSSARAVNTTLEAERIRLIEVTDILTQNIRACELALRLLRGETELSHSLPYTSVVTPSAASSEH